MYTYLSGSTNISARANKAIYNNTGSWLNVTKIDGDSGSIVSLINNGTIINTGTSTMGNYTLYPVTGLYNITGSIASSQNYTSCSEAWTLTVTAPSTGGTTAVPTLTSSTSNKRPYGILGSWLDFRWKN